MPGASPWIKDSQLLGGLVPGLTPLVPASSEPVSLPTSPKIVASLSSSAPSSSCKHEEIQEQNHQ